MPVPTPAPPSGPTHPGRTLPSPAPCDSSRQQIQIMLHRLLYPDPLIQGELCLHPAHATALDCGSGCDPARQPSLLLAHQTMQTPQIIEGELDNHSAFAASLNTQTIGTSEQLRMMCSLDEYRYQPSQLRSITGLYILGQIPLVKVGFGMLNGVFNIRSPENVSVLRPNQIS